MKARTWKWIGGGLAAASLATAGVLFWQDRRETAAKAALSAEIRASRAARPKVTHPVPTAEELETADQYSWAIAKLQVDEYYGDFCTDAEKAPWAEVPESVATMLKANAAPLAMVDAAADRNACRFADTSLQKSHGKCMRLVGLLTARGHAALAAGSPMAAAEEVRRILRVGRDLVATPASSAPAEGGDCWPWPDLVLRMAEQDAAALLSALASAPDLPPEAGAALLAAARAPWGSAEAFRRSIDFYDDASDVFALQILGPDARALLDKADAQSAEIQDLLKSVAPNQGFLEKARTRLRAALRPSIPIPPAAEIREYQAMKAPVVAAVRRRDIPALAPGSPLDRSGRAMRLLSPLHFRLALADEARIEAARAAAAIRAFQLKEGRAPGTLEELVPSLLAEVPMDPFDGRPLSYETDGKAWRVASRIWRETREAGDESGDSDPPVEVRSPRAAK